MNNKNFYKNYYSDVNLSDNEKKTILNDLHSQLSKTNAANIPVTKTTKFRTAVSVALSVSIITSALSYSQYSYRHDIEINPYETTIGQNVVSDVTTVPENIDSDEIISVNSDNVTEFTDNTDKYENGTNENTNINTEADNGINSVSDNNSTDTEGENTSQIKGTENEESKDSNYVTVTMATSGMNGDVTVTAYETVSEVQTTVQEETSLPALTTAVSTKPPYFTTTVTVVPMTTRPPYFTTTVQMTTIAVTTEGDVACTTTVAPGDFAESTTTTTTETSYTDTVYVPPYTYEEATVTQPPFEESY